MKSVKFLSKNILATKVNKKVTMTKTVWEKVVKLSNNNKSLKILLKYNNRYKIWEKYYLATNYILVLQNNIQF